jgi:hypothetical protein
MFRLKGSPSLQIPLYYRGSVKGELRPTLLVLYSPLNSVLAGGLIMEYAHGIPSLSPASLSFGVGTEEIVMSRLTFGLFRRFGLDVRQVSGHPGLNDFLSGTSAAETTREHPTILARCAA